MKARNKTVKNTQRGHLSASRDGRSAIGPTGAPPVLLEDENEHYRWDPDFLDRLPEILKIMARYDLLDKGRCCAIAELGLVCPSNGTGRKASGWLVLGPGDGRTLSLGGVQSRGSNHYRLADRKDRRQNGVQYAVMYPDELHAAVGRAILDGLRAGVPGRRPSLL